MKFKNKLRLFIFPAILIPVILVIIINYFVTGAKMRNMQFELMQNKAKNITRQCDIEFNIVRALRMDEVEYFREAVKRKLIKEMEQTLTQGNKLTVINTDTGALVYSSHLEIDEFFSKSEEVKKALHSQSGTFKYVMPAESGKSKTYFVAFSSYTNFNWLIVESMDKDIANKYFYDATALSAITVFLFMIIILFVVYRLAENISNKIEFLEKGTLQISRNDFDLNMEIKSNDEFGSLAKKFNLMAFEIKKKQLDILEQKEWLEVILKGIGEGIILLGLDHKVQFTNIMTETLTGYSKEEILGEDIHTIFKIVEEQTRSRVENPGSLIINQENLSLTKPDDVSEIIIKETSAPKVLISKQGKEYFIEAQANTIISSEGKLVQVVMVFRDVTEKHIAKQKAEKMITLKTEFFSNISHEFRTPLNVLYCTVQLFESYAKKQTIFTNELVSKHLRVIKQNTLRIIRLSNNIIDLSKIDSGFYKPVFRNKNIVDIIEKIVNSVYEYAIQKNMQITFESNVKEAIIKCDVDMLERILLNLISNAIKFSDRNSLIQVSITVSSELIMIKVKDNGVGIPKDQQEIIFQRYKQSTTNLLQKSEGSGIGLTLTKFLVQMHGGSIVVNSSIGQGSEFIIKIPNVLQKKYESKEIENFTKNDREHLVSRINVEFSDVYF